MQGLVGAMVHEDLLHELAHNIHILPFEARKDTQTIFSHVLRFRPAHAAHGDPPVISYIVHHRPEIIVELCRGYNYSQSAMPCGTILREALKFDVIAAIILYDQSTDYEPAIRLTNVRPGNPQNGDGVFWQFFGWIDRGSFEVSADAFTTFRVRMPFQPISGPGFLTNGNSLGDFDSTQVGGGRIPGGQLRLILFEIQQYPYTVRVICDQATEYQAPWGAFTRPRQLQCDDGVCRERREPQTVHETAARRPKDGSIRRIPRVQGMYLRFFRGVAMVGMR